MSLGETFRLARENRGLTISQVAEATRMMSQIVEDLEREDFRRIAAPIYGRGFIKLYAEYLALDAEPLIREFVEIYTGSRAPQVTRRTEASAPLAEPPCVAAACPPPEASPELASEAPPATPTAPHVLVSAMPSGEPDLFSIAAVRSEAVRSVADPTQAGDTVPPRVRPATGATAGKPMPAKFRPPGTVDATPFWGADLLRWRPTRGQVMVGGGVALLVVLLLLGVRGCKKRPPSPRAARPPIAVERVLPPAAPYFD
jgi:transcriptional regulator with XRE-family HTH domain